MMLTRRWDLKTGLLMTLVLGLRYAMPITATALMARLSQELELRRRADSNKDVQNLKATLSKAHRVSTSRATTQHHLKSTNPLALLVLTSSGVVSAHDVLEFMIRGGAAVQVATAVLDEGPKWIEEALQETMEVLGGDDLPTYIAKGGRSLETVKDLGESRMSLARVHRSSNICTGRRLCLNQ
jgi:hypothetical protein